MADIDQYITVLHVTTCINIFVEETHTVNSYLNCLLIAKLLNELGCRSPYKKYLAANPPSADVDMKGIDSTVFPFNYVDVHKYQIQRLCLVVWKKRLLKI